MPSSPKIFPTVNSSGNINGGEACFIALPKEHQASSLNTGVEYSTHEKQTPKPRQYCFCFGSPPMENMSKFVAELIGTALLMFGGCMGGLTWGKEPNSFFSALSFGMVVMTLVQAYSAVSGAHFNPAVTLAALLFKLISLPMAGIYFIAQLTGAVIGYGLLKALTPYKVFFENAGEYGFCATVPQSDLSTIQIFMHEYLATMFLITLCCSVWDHRNARNTDSIPLKFGLAITVLSMIFGPYTGCSMNPARSFAPAFWNNNFVVHWIYWLAPLLSAAVTTITYKSFFLPSSASQSNAEINK